MANNNLNRPRVLIQVSFKNLSLNFTNNYRSQNLLRSNIGNASSINELAPPDANSSGGFYCVISVATGGYIHDKDKIQTEIIDSFNPTFKCCLIFEYLFEERQLINVDLFLSNGMDNNIQFIEHLECTVGRVIHSGGEMKKVLKNIVPDAASPSNFSDEPRRCEMTVSVKEDFSCKETIQIKLKGYGLDKKDRFGKSDPYIVLIRKNDRGKLIRTYRSEVIKNSLNPVWKPISVSVERLCNSNLDNEIVLRCYDWDGANGDS